VAILEFSIYGPIFLADLKFCKSANILVFPLKYTGLKCSVSHLDIIRTNLRPNFDVLTSMGRNFLSMLYLFHRNKLQKGVICYSKRSSTASNFSVRPLKQKSKSAETVDSIQACTQVIHVVHNFGRYEYSIVRYCTCSKTKQQEVYYCT
jgi:hypothetical protein